MHTFISVPACARHWRNMLTLVAATLAVTAGTTDVAAQTSYSGRCAAACVRQTLPPPNEQCFADTGTLPGGGGSLSAGEPGVQVGLDVYAATNLTASALAGGGSTTCSTAQQQVSAFGGLLVAASVRADARADCSGATGSSTISGLVFGGLAIVVTGAANQTVSIPGVATLVINEHVAGSASTELTVNALRLTLATGEQLTLCTANVGVLCSVAATDASWGTLKARYE